MHNHLPTVYIKELTQLDNHTFMIFWNDGRKGRYRLSDLQERCPCAACLDQMTGRRSYGIKSDPDVRAIRIYSVGRYAIKIEYSSGCSLGIYDYHILHRMARL